MHLSTIGVFIDLALVIIGSHLTMPFLVAGLPSNVRTSPHSTHPESFELQSLTISRSGFHI